MKRFLFVLMTMLLISTMIPLEGYAGKRKEEKERAKYTDAYGNCIPLFKGKPAKEFVHSWVPNQIQDKWVNKPAYRGKPVVSFTIGEDGYIRDFEFVEYSGDVKMDEIIKTVFLSSPKWYPKLIKGKPAPHKFTVTLNMYIRAKNPYTYKSKTKKATGIPAGGMASPGRPITSSR